MENNATVLNIEEEQAFSFRDFLSLCGRQWKWFLLSVILFVALGVFYILRQQPVYSRTMAVLITDQDGGGGVGDIANAFSSMGLVSSNTKVNNELIALLSPAVMFEVVERLDLDTDVTKKGMFHGTTLYGTAAPFSVTLDDVPQTNSAGFRMDVNPDGSGELYKFYRYEDGKKIKLDGSVRIPAGYTCTVKTPVGRVTFRPNPEYNGLSIDEPSTIMVSRSSLQGAVEKYMNKLEGELTDQDADVIDLSITDVSIQRANDILNTIIAVYNENWVNDKNRIAVATSAFIGERLGLIEKELGEVDDDISEYKTKNLVTDLGASASLAMTQAAKQSDEILAVTNQLAMANYVKEYVTDKEHRYDVIPVNTGLGNPVLDNQIAAYNQTLLQRNNLETNASASNPIVREMDTQLVGLRESIVRSIITQIAQLQATLSNMQRSQSASERQLASTPGQAKYLLSVERQQKVKEALYLYLLQKREETELTQTFTAYNTRIITPPFGSMRPVSPKTNLIYVVMVLLGLGLPAIFIYVREATDSTIRGRRDLEHLPVPLTGEIPQMGSESALKRRLRTKKQQQAHIDRPLIVVEEGNRNAINEAFRLVRSNIQMMSAKNGGCQVIMLTSFNPGSGKSFIAYNLGVSFAIKGKRVLVIDGDLRHGSLSMYVGSPSRGLTGYLTEQTDDWKALLRKVDGYPTYDVMPIGHRPPNPAELLENGRLETLMQQVRADYDFVLIDCPPTDIVVDTRIFSEYVDRTVFVVRAGLLDRSVLPVITRLYKDKTYPRMSLLLNGSVQTGPRGAYGGYYSGDYYSS